MLSERCLLIALGHSGLSVLSLFSTILISYFSRVSFFSLIYCCFFFFSSRRRHTRSDRDWSSDVCSSDLGEGRPPERTRRVERAAGAFGARAAHGGRDSSGLRDRLLSGRARRGGNFPRGQIGRASCRGRG